MITHRSHRMVSRGQREECSLCHGCVCHNSEVLSRFCRFNDTYLSAVKRLNRELDGENVPRINGVPVSQMKFDTENDDYRAPEVNEEITWENHPDLFGVRGMVWGVRVAAPQAKSVDEALFDRIRTGVMCIPCLLEEETYTKVPCPTHMEG